MQVYLRKGTFKPQDVLEFIGDYKKMYLGVDVKMGSLRYQTFQKSLTCKRCGVEGKFFALEKHRNGQSDRFHFNLYAIDDNGDELLMTKDHIVPRSKGGPNHVTNMQTMCTVCNGIKDNNIE